VAKTTGLITAREAFEKSTKIIKEAERVKHENAQLFLDANLNTRVQEAAQEGFFHLEMEIPTGVDGRTIKTILEDLGYQVKLTAYRGTNKSKIQIWWNDPDEDD
jgi:hypothetical protein